MKKKKQFKVIAGLSGALLCATMLSAAHVQAEGVSETPVMSEEEKEKKELEDLVKNNYWAGELVYYKTPLLSDKGFIVPKYLKDYFESSAVKWVPSGIPSLSMPNSGLVDKEYAAMPPILANIASTYGDNSYSIWYYSWSKTPEELGGSFHSKMEPYWDGINYWNPYNFDKNNDLLIGKIDIGEAETTEEVEIKDPENSTDYTARGDITERGKDSKKIMTHDAGDKINLDFSVDIDYLRRFLNTWLLREINKDGPHMNIVNKNTPETGITQSDAEFIFVVDLPKGLEANDATKYSIDSTLEDKFDIKYDIEKRKVKENVFNTETKKFEEVEVDKDRLVVRMRKVQPESFEKLKDFYKKVQGLKNITLKVDNLVVTKDAAGKNNTATGYVYGIHDHVLTANEEAIKKQDPSLVNWGLDDLDRPIAFFAAKQSDAGRDETLDKDNPNLITYTFRVPYIVNFMAHLSEEFFENAPLTNMKSIKVEGNKSIMDGAINEEDANIPNAPFKYHTTFKGWNTKQDGTGEWFDDSFAVLSDMNVYAIYNNRAPKISVVKEKSITQGDKLDLFSLLNSATDFEDGDLKLTKNVKIKEGSNFDANKVGEYKVTFIATDALGKTAEATSTIMVLPKMNIAPVLEVEDKTINVGDYIDLRDLVKSAKDKEDGVLKDKVIIVDDSNFTNKKSGKYKITFKVTDSQKASARKVATVTVKDKVEIPNEAPKEEGIVAKTTRFIDEEGKEVKAPDTTGFVEADKYIRNDKGEIVYEYKSTSETEDLRTHMYTKVTSSVPNDAPKEEVSVLKTTRFIDEEGKEVKAPVEGFVDVDKYDHIRNDKGEITYTFKEKLPDTKDVRTYVYTPVVHEVGEPEKNELAVAKTTKHLIEGTNKEIAEAEVGEDFAEHKTGIIEKDGKEYFFNKTDETSEVRTHWYAPVVGEVPNDAPKEEVPVLKTTRFIDEEGKEVKAPVEGFVDANKYDYIRNDKGEITYTFKEKLPDTKDVRTYVYTPVVHKVGDPLVEEKPEFKYEVGDPEVNELPEMPLDKVPTYNEVPNEAPSAEAPILKTTRHLVKGTDEVLAVDMDFVENRGEIVHNGKVYKYISSLADTTDLRTHYYEEVKQPTPGGQTPPPITPEVTPPSEDPSVPEVTPPSEDPSVPEVTPPSEDPSVSEVTPPSEDPSVPEITPPSEDSSVPEVTPPSEDPSVPEVTPPSGITTEQEGKTPNTKVTKSENLPTTDAAQNASIFGTGLLGLLMLKLRNRRKEK